MVTAVYPGTFDPFTKGHTDIIERASKMFDRVIVAVVDNQNKRMTFSLEERIEMGNHLFAHLPNVDSLPESGQLTVEFVVEHGAQVILRGLRATSDFEYEFQLASMNRSLNPDIETMFLTPSQEYTYLSSSLIKEVVSLGGDASKFLDPFVLDKLKVKFGAK